MPPTLPSTNSLRKKFLYPIVLVSPQIRAALKQITENHLPQLVVLSFNEITRDTQVMTLGLATDS